jgi:hypothetical protein
MKRFQVFRALPSIERGGEERRKKIEKEDREEQ